MSTYNAQNPSEMLHLLIDGELESTMETPLYASLLESEDLRSELRELIAIRESVRKDVEAYTPPVAATHSIFNRLGYTPPIPVQNNPVTGGGFLYNLKNSLWHPVTTAIVASCITALFFLNFNQDETNTMATNTVKNQSGQGGANILRAQSMPSAPIASIAKDEFSIVRHRSAVKSAPIVESDGITDTQEEVILLADNDNNSSETLLASLPSSFFQQEYSGGLKPLKHFSEQTQAPVREFSLIEDDYTVTAENGHSLLLQIRGINAASFPNVEIDNQPNVLLNNLSFSALLKISDNIHVGLEIGQESFGLKYWNVEKEGRNKSYYQYLSNPALLWGGIGVKMSWDEHIELLANAQPFIHAILGSTNIGPLGKATAGLQFVSEGGLGIIIGIEGSSLLYQNQSRLYSTEKLGITYGMFVKL